MKVIKTEDGKAWLLMLKGKKANGVEFVYYYTTYPNLREGILKLDLEGWQGGKYSEILVDWSKVDSLNIIK
jgi:hypothetical protein